MAGRGCKSVGESALQAAGHEDDSDAVAGMQSVLGGRREREQAKERCECESRGVCACASAAAAAVLFFVSLSPLHSLPTSLFRLAKEREEPASGIQRNPVTRFLLSCCHPRDALITHYLYTREERTGTAGAGESNEL